MWYLLGYFAPGEVLRPIQVALHARCSDSSSFCVRYQRRELLGHVALLERFQQGLLLARAALAVCSDTRALEESTYGDCTGEVRGVLMVPGAGALRDVPGPPARGPTICARRPP